MADSSRNALEAPCSCPIGLQCKYTACFEQILGVFKKKIQSYMKTSTLYCSPLSNSNIISNQSIIQTVVSRKRRAAQLYKQKKITFVTWFLIFLFVTK